MTGKNELLLEKLNPEEMTLDGLKSKMTITNTTSTAMTLGQVVIPAKSQVITLEELVETTKPEVRRRYDRKILLDLTGDFVTAHITAHGLPSSITGRGYVIDEAKALAKAFMDEMEI